MAANLSRQPIKAGALDFLKHGTEIQRGTMTALPAGLENAERRERSGQDRSTMPRRRERIEAEKSPDLQRIVEIARSTREQESSLEL